MTGVQTVFLIMMENESWAQIGGNTASAPYINSLLTRADAAYATQYYTPPGNHPSLPNYLWLDAGACFTYCGTDNPPAASPGGIAGQGLHSLLNGAGISWREYAEGIGDGSCPLADSGAYVTRHDPFVYFNDVSGTRSCVHNVRSFSDLADDLTYSTTARFNVIIPGVCDDMHDSCAPLNDPIKQGDAWLQTTLPPILGSSAYAQNGLVLILWDEGTNDSDGPIGLIALSRLTRGNGYAGSVHYTHSSTLRSLEEIFGVGPPLGDAANAADLSDLFR
jgi:hypothetical protein